MDVTCIVTTATGSETRYPVWLPPSSRVGSLFGDPTVQSVVIVRTADGAILKGSKTVTYIRQKGTSQ
jgi:hypothetical protein